MAFTDLNPTLQNILQLEYEFQVKFILLFGWWVISLFYVFFLYKNQKPTPYFFLGTIRAVLYTVAYMWMWLFFLLFPVYIHPNQGIDELLLFVASVYSILFFVFTTVLLFNAGVWIPKFIVQRGKIDIKTWEDGAFTKYFGKSFKR